MLLEYFLSSTRQDSSMDIKSSSNNASQNLNVLTDGNNEQFKNTLNSTIESRQKYHVKQNDTPFSESELLHTVQQWDKLYSNADNTSNTESIDNLNQFFETKEALSLAIAAKKQGFNSQYNVGDIVPTDGKSLPDNVATNQISPDANVVLKASEILTSDAVKSIPMVNNNSIQQSTNNQVEGQIKDQAINQKSAKLNTEFQLQTTIQNKDGVISKQSLDASKPNEMNVTNNAKSDKSILNTISLPKNINFSPVVSEVKGDDKAAPTKSEIINNLLSGTKTVTAEPITAKAAPTKSEIINNLLSGTKTVTAEPIKDKAEQSSNASSSNSLKALTGLLDANDKLTNIIANKEQSNSKISADNAILKSANIPVQVIKSNQSEVLASKDIPSSELDKKLTEKSQLIQPKQVNDLLLQSARRADTTASLLQTSALNATSQDSSTSSAIKPLNVTIMDSSAVQNQLNSAQNINRASDTPLSAGVSANKWNQKFAQHVSMLALRGSTNAQIRLDPPELGPMAIRINHTGTETQVQFMVHNAVAKELVDSGTQRLREMLE
ncbi:MAG: flagellar hook-length control protein FliK, partial [Enterobacterales bacterium]